MSEVTDYLVDGLQKLARAGADFGIIAANTPHIVFDDVQQRSPHPADQHRRGDLRGGEEARDWSPDCSGRASLCRRRSIRTFFRGRELAVVMPHEDEQDYIHEKYVGELLKDTFLPETREDIRDHRHG